MARRAVSKRKKSVRLPRKIKTGLNAAPTDSWNKFFDYMRMDVEGKEISSVLKTYIKDTYKGAERKVLLSAPENIYSMSTGAAATIHWNNLGYTTPDNWNDAGSIHLAIQRIRRHSKKVEEKTETKKVSPMTLLKRKISDKISELENVVDNWREHEEYSVYSDLQSNQESANMASAIMNYYTPLLEELTELCEQRTSDLVEAYSNMSVPDRKKFMAFIENICKEADQYALSKKAVRAPRKKKAKSADKQVAKIQYLSNSNEYKLTSINPTTIVGAMRLYTFNTQNRTLTEYVSKSHKGFEVKGTTLQMWDEEASRSIRLRKPDEVLPLVLKSTTAKINRTINDLTTKQTKSNGRINKYTILLKAMNK